MSKQVEASAKSCYVAAVVKLKIATIIVKHSVKDSVMGSERNQAIIIVFLLNVNNSFS